MTTGRVVVVVGGEVVVALGSGVVVGEVVSDEEPAPGEVGVVVGRGDVVVVEPLGVEVVGADVFGTGTGSGLEDALAPGCSLATTTPIAKVAPVASNTAERVRRRRRASARCLVSGELCCGDELIDRSANVASRPTEARCSEGSQRECVPWGFCETPVEVPLDSRPLRPRPAPVA